MTVLSGLELVVDVDAVLAGQGCNPAVVRARGGPIVEAAERALALGGTLVSAAVATSRLAVTGLAFDRVDLERGSVGGRLPRKVLAHAGALVVGVATVGRALEDRVSALLSPDPLSALALDGYGNAALSALARLVCDRIGSEAESRSWRATPPISPGLGGWPLDSGQRDLFALVDAGSIGVSLTPLSLMRPRKSLSFMVGMGPGVEAGGQTCDWCGMRERCRFRGHE